MTLQLLHVIRDYTLTRTSIPNQYSEVVLERPVLGHTKCGFK